MVIELIDGTRVENVKGVYGGPKLINGVSRDTLKIEIDANSNVSLDDLKSIFSNNLNTMYLYTYNTIVNNDKSETQEKVVMGEGYTIFVSAKTIKKNIPHAPGKLLPDTTEDIHEIIIAQITYDEYTNALNEVSGGV